MELKRMALANPTLAFPDHSKPFYLFVDASVGGTAHSPAVQHAARRDSDEKLAHVNRGGVFHEAH